MHQEHKQQTKKQDFIKNFKILCIRRHNQKPKQQPEEWEKKKSSNYKSCKGDQNPECKRNSYKSQQKDK